MRGNELGKIEARQERAWATQFKMKEMDAENRNLAIKYKLEADKAAR